MPQQLTFVSQPFPQLFKLNSEDPYAKSTICCTFAGIHVVTVVTPSVLKSTAFAVEAHSGARAAQVFPIELMS